MPVYVIYYGEFSTGTQGIIDNFFTHLGGTSYFGVNRTYYDAQMQPVTGTLSYPNVNACPDHYSQGIGTTLGSTSIPKIIQAAIAPPCSLQADPKAVYFVITSPDVKVSGFCRSFCAYHTRTTINGADIKYALVPDPGQACTGCDGNFAVYGDPTTPNADWGADEVVDSAFHELSETVTDPDLNAWYTSNGSENGDLCNYVYGTTSISSNGVHVNAHIGSLDYLIQTIWENTGAGFCANTYTGP